MHTLKHWLGLWCLLLAIPATAAKPTFSVIAYYTGDSKLIDYYETAKLTHQIFSFCHLKDGRLNVANARDTATIHHLVGLKQQYPRLKIMLSLGGWGGCAPCSETFSTHEGRLRFARSVKELNDYYGNDGLDLDWEYPTIPGFPGHLYQAADRDNFTELVSGYATVTGHHTPLFSTRPGEQSADHAVNYLLGLGIPASKLVIGAAFYTRIWNKVAPDNKGLYQPGEHTHGVNFSHYDSQLIAEKGWTCYWDNDAKASWWYNAQENKFATGDDLRSVREKAAYVKKKKLGGIMFWELTLDKPTEGMLDAIDEILAAP